MHRKCQRSPQREGSSNVGHCPGGGQTWGPEKSNFWMRWVGRHVEPNTPMTFHSRQHQAHVEPCTCVPSSPQSDTSTPRGVPQQHALGQVFYFALPNKKLQTRAAQPMLQHCRKNAARSLSVVPVLTPAWDCPAGSRMETATWRESSSAWATITLPRL